MRILSLDTSSKTASAAVVDEEGILAESFVSVGLTHSETLMPMIHGMLAAAKMKISDIDSFAVSHGPGSFTGIRIGIGALKGLAQGLQKGCIGISTLEGLAGNFRGLSGLFCPVMDARCGQVYTALFRGENGLLTRLWEDDACSVKELGDRLARFDQQVTLVGDGALLCDKALKDTVPNLCLAPVQLRLQKASSIGLAALEYLKARSPLSPDELVPAYLRLPQAQRELLKKEKGRDETCSH